MKTVLLVSVVLSGMGLAGGGCLRAQSVSEVSATPGSAGTIPDGLEPGGSQVRIVRLSTARGSVQMDRNTGRGFEGAFANIPVIAGAKLRTGDGVAEVEFEDNSSLRLAPGSEVEFVQLGRSATGETLTTVQVRKGLAYVSLQKGKDAGQFALTDSAARVVLSPGTHLRLDATQPQVELAVFEGAAEVVMGSSSTMVAKRESLTLNPVTQTMTSVQKGTEEAGWDEWDKAETAYHKGASGFAGSGGGFGLYGVNDLNYYGSFVDMPGCGSMWRPYFASAGWDPFANGIWAYYPVAGFSWVSPYPWGWMPYHSGTWANCGAAGWGWRPGGTWMGLRNQLMMRIARHPMPHPVPPTPVRGSATLVPVNAKPLTMSGMGSEGKFSFRQDSAGLGVPREAFGRLGGVSTRVEQQGVANRGVPMNAMVSIPESRGGHYAGAAASGRSAGYSGTARSSSGGGFSASSGSHSGSSGSYTSGSSSSSASMASSGASMSSSGGASGGSHH